VGWTASLWNLETGQREGTFPSDSITSPLAQFSSNNDLVVAYEGWASVWPSDVASWADYACEVAGRDFTSDEWNQLLPGRPYQHVC